MMYGIAKVELLYFDGCSGYRKAEQSLKDALSREGVRSEVELVTVNTDEEAGALEFPGSPTVRLDGRDLFPMNEREDWRLGCRVYATPEGLKDHPTEEMIQAVLRGARFARRTRAASPVVERVSKGRTPKTCSRWNSSGSRFVPSSRGRSTGSSRCGHGPEGRHGRPEVERREVVIDEPFLT